METLKCQKLKLDTSTKKSVHRPTSYWDYIYGNSQVAHNYIKFPLFVDQLSSKNVYCASNFVVYFPQHTVEHGELCRQMCFSHHDQHHYQVQIGSRCQHYNLTNTSNANTRFWGLDYLNVPQDVLRWLLNQVICILKSLTCHNQPEGSGQFYLETQFTSIRFIEVNIK